jgi:hypothetical protein
MTIAYEDGDMAFWSELTHLVYKANLPLSFDVAEKKLWSPSITYIQFKNNYAQWFK